MSEVMVGLVRVLGVMIVAACLVQVRTDWRVLFLLGVACLVIR